MMYEGRVLLFAAKDLNKIDSIAAMEFMKYIGGEMDKKGECCDTSLRVPPAVLRLPCSTVKCSVMANLWFAEKSRNC